MKGAPSCPPTTTSSSSGPAPAEARSSTRSRLPASASCSSSAATTCRARRPTGAPARSTSRAGTRPRRSGATGDGRALHPHTNYYVGGNTKFYGAALFRLRREDFGELKHHGGISPAWPIAYEDLEPYYTRAERLYHVHGERGRRSDRPAGERAVPAPGGEPRAAHPAALRRPGAPGPPAVSRAARHHARREERAKEPVHPLRDLRRAPVPGRREVRRPGGLRGPDARAAPERDAADRRLRHAAGDQPVRARGDGRGRRAGGRVGDILGRHCRRVGGGHQLRRAAAALGQRPAPAGPRQRLRRGRPALHGPCQLDPAGAVEVPQPYRLPEDARAERLLLRLGRLGVPHGAHLLRGQGRRRHLCARARPPSRRAGRSS